MSKYDPETAREIADLLLADQNPPTEDQDRDAINEARVTELFEALDQRGIQISSLSETDLREHCYKLGLNEDQVSTAIDEWTSWAVTDDV